MNKIIGTIFIIISVLTLIFTVVIAINEFPWIDAYNRNLSKRYISQKKYLLGVKEAKKAVIFSPLDIRNLRQLLLAQYYAGVNLDKKYQKENIAVAEKLVYYSPTDPLNWDLLGLVYLDLGRLQDAKRAFVHEKLLAPNTTGVHLHLGEVLKQQGKIKDAIGYYKKAVEISGGWDFAKRELEKAEKLLSQE